MATEYGPVDASPLKSFFVTMLTKDIPLQDAILDLLDNCVDGALRTRHDRGGERPYEGFRAEITFDANTFMIWDNCGGIPWALPEYAFRMGRRSDHPNQAPSTIGVYGIGMKRAIFKMGERCLISTQSGDDRYEVAIDENWIKDEFSWEIPVRPAEATRGPDGTTILVGNLYPGIAARMGDNIAFTAELRGMISTHYAFIIAKGFEVRLNGETVAPRPTRLVFDTAPAGKKAESIQPFIFKTTTDDGVDVFMAVGFTRPIPSSMEIDGEDVDQKYSTLDAGWTVVCNDRAVLYCNRDELTGWGETGVPRYHTQFIAISGIVEFRCDDPSKLPTTTTKRDIDASSQLYLRAKNKMREGMALFTNYTNRWKGRADESRVHIEAATPLSWPEVKAEAARLDFARTVRSTLPGLQYKPSLPMPKVEEPTRRRISYVRSIDDIRELAEHLFDDPGVDPATVGSRCFDLMLKEARR